MMENVKNRAGQTGLVLIHGAGLGNYVWDKLTPMLQYPVLAIEFPNREKHDKANADYTFDDYIQPASEQIKAWQMEKIVLVTHSIGGCIGLSLADTFADKLVGFVAIGASIPSNGQSFADCFNFPMNYLLPLILKLVGTRPPKKAIQAQLCNDLTELQSAEIIRRFSPESRDLYVAKISYKPLQVPKMYIQLSNDKVFTMPMQVAMASRLSSAKIATLASGHLPMLSQPSDLSTLLNDFVAHLS